VTFCGTTATARSYDARMRTLALVLLVAATAPLAAQDDLLRRTAVLKLPGMEQVEVRKNLEYANGRRFDLYLPPNATGPLPLVIFINGVARPDLKEWGQYTSWPRLAAARGMAAITYETEPTDVSQLAQTQLVLARIRERAGELKIDPKRIALWACSANARVATELLATQPADDFRAAVFYYGIMETPPKHAAVPLFVARAGIDALAINESIDRWAALAVQLDAPVTLVAYPQGRHAFDVIDDTEQSRRIITDTLDFLRFHLTTPQPPRTEPVTPAELQRILREKGAAAFAARVREIRATHPNAMAVQEQALNAFAYSLLQSQKVADAVVVFELIVSLHPASANAYDSLGDGYAAARRIPEAIAASERALELLDKVPESRRAGIRASAEEKLKRLRK
jgi:dienelactone hydrolase